jgi:hypothetical protein
MAMDITTSTKVNPAPAFRLLFCPKRSAIQDIGNGASCPLPTDKCSKGYTTIWRHSRKGMAEGGLTTGGVVPKFDKSASDIAAPL